MFVTTWHEKGEQRREINEEEECAAATISTQICVCVCLRDNARRRCWSMPQSHWFMVYAPIVPYTYSRTPWTNDTIPLRLINKWRNILVISRLKATDIHETRSNQLLMKIVSIALESSTHHRKCIFYLLLFVRVQKRLNPLNTFITLGRVSLFTKYGFFLGGDEYSNKNDR